jgi:hypothetical protein
VPVQNESHSLKKILLYYWEVKQICKGCRGNYM